MKAISVEVVYALRARQEIVRLELSAGVTAIAAVHASGLAERHPEIDLTHGKIGVFGTVVAPDARLADGDRVEIYRPLAVDPRAARRARVAARAKAVRPRR